MIVESINWIRACASLFIENVIACQFSSISHKICENNEIEPRNSFAERMTLCGDAKIRKAIENATNSILLHLLKKNHAGNVCPTVSDKRRLFALSNTLAS